MIGIRPARVDDAVLLAPMLETAIRASSDPDTSLLLRRVVGST